MPRMVKSSYESQTEEYKKVLRIGMAYKNYKQKDLMKRLGVSQSTVSRMLSDPDTTQFGELRSLASCLGLEIIIREKE